ncbi:MAG: hypothetical protein JWR69_3333 [Pedosphaera sp.]|nr:hypothetical protein [Pedosphaera sp.]
MNTILQDPRTGLFCVNPGHWTPDERQARVFENSLEAIGFCTAHHLPPTRVILKYEPDRYYDVKLMVTNAGVAEWPPARN